MKLFGVTGRKNSGKTRLMAGLVQEFRRQGLHVSSIKHSHHSMAIDEVGRDSWQHLEAGAEEVMLATPDGWRLMRKTPSDLTLSDLLMRMAPVDLVLVEGFKDAPIRKLETYRQGQSEPLLAAQRADILAVVANTRVPTDLPIFAPDDVAAITRFIRETVGL